MLPTVAFILRDCAESQRYNPFGKGLFCPGFIWINGSNRSYITAKKNPDADQNSPNLDMKAASEHLETWELETWPSGLIKPLAN